jgi:hypothetical protein
MKDAMIRIAPLLLLAGFAGAAERINQEGRILGPLMAVSAPTEFNTAAADMIVATMQIFPVDNAWNEDVSRLPLLGGSSDPTQSNAMIAQIRSDVYTQQSGQTDANRQRVVVFQEMNYVLVPDTQPLVDILFNTYPDDSDYNGGTNPIATWPIPGNMPIETWPTGTGSLTLPQWQMDSTDGGDRHSVVVQPGVGRTFETWMALLTTNTPAWEAANGCIFDLTSDTLRPAGETSGDAAGLSLFPALVRYDEAERGMVEHAMRIVVQRSRQAYIYPATHEAGSTTAAQVPAMGQRLRLKSSFVIPASWSKEETAIAKGLQKYGALVADNGSFFSISICPDQRWPAGCFDHLSQNAGSDFCDIDNFEVVASTGATGGPRSPGAPSANAGADQTVTLTGGAQLSGAATGSGLTTLWYLYPLSAAPGTVTITNAGALSTTASFSATGAYTLMLEASDGVHTPAYSYCTVTVQAAANPAPTLTAISPTTAVQYSGAFTMTVTGTGFVPASQLTWSGHANLAAATASSTQLTVAIPASYLASVGTPGIAVTSPAPGGGATSAQTFTITADVTPPVISAVTVSAIGPGGATISWTTNELATDQVAYGLTTAYGSTSALGAAFTTSHAQVISGLSASTTYHFQVTSSDQAGNAATSADATFATSAPPSAASGGSGHHCGGGIFGAIGVLLGFALRRQGATARAGRAPC